MSATQSKPFPRYRDGVTNLMRAGEPFGEVENVIDHADVSEDQKAALWLWAFSLLDRTQQERDARAYLAGVADA